MLIVECPLCDAPAPYDADGDSLDCPVCSVHLDLAADGSVTELATAA